MNNNSNVNEAQNAKKMTERTGKNCKVKTMEIKLVRIAKRQTYTIGALYLDDEPWRLCDTLEPRCRNFKFQATDGPMDRSLKVQLAKERGIKKHALADGKQVYITITSSKGCIDPLTD